MTFIADVEEERFDDFVRNHPAKSHFMQSAAWGEFNRAARGLIPHRIGLENKDGALAAAALLLWRKPPFFPGYFYAPRGFVLDFENAALLKEFTAAAAEYCKKRGAMFLKIDPDVELREIGADGEPMEGGFSNMALVERLREMGFRHRGFNKRFDRRQPRYTFRVDLRPEEAEIEKRISGNVMKNVRKGERYAAEIYMGGSADVKHLARLIGETGERDDFYAYGEDYYQKFYDILAARGMAELYMGKTFPAEIGQQLRRQLEEVRERKKTLTKDGPRAEAETTERRLLREIEAYDGYAKRYGSGAVTNAHLVVRYGAHAWAVHAGSATDMKETFLNNRVYLFKILNEKKDGAVWLDQFGTVGDPENSPLRSLHEFKRQFGGRYIEFIGEFDLVFRKFWYFVYEKALPRYRAFRFGVKAVLRRLKISRPKKAGKVEK